MRLNKFSKLAALTLAGGLVLGSGCSLNGLLRNVWVGFGYSLGSIPADIVGGWIEGFLTPDTTA